MIKKKFEIEGTVVEGKMVQLLQNGKITALPLKETGRTLGLYLGGGAVAISGVVKNIPNVNLISGAKYYYTPTGILTVNATNNTFIGTAISYNTLKLENEFKASKPSIIKKFDIHNQATEGQVVQLLKNGKINNLPLLEFEINISDKQVLSDINFESMRKEHFCEIDNNKIVVVNKDYCYLLKVDNNKLSLLEKFEINTSRDYAITKLTENKVLIVNGGFKSFYSDFTQVFTWEYNEEKGINKRSEQVDFEADSMDFANFCIKRISSNKAIVFYTKSGSVYYLYYKFVNIDGDQITVSDRFKTDMRLADRGFINLTDINNTEGLVLYPTASNLYCFKLNIDGDVAKLQCHILFNIEDTWLTGISNCMYVGDNKFIISYCNSKEDYKKHEIKLLEYTDRFTIIKEMSVNIEISYPKIIDLGANVYGIVGEKNYLMIDSDLNIKGQGSIDTKGRNIHCLKLNDFILCQNDNNLFFADIKKLNGKMLGLYLGNGNVAIQGLARVNGNYKAFKNYYYDESGVVSRDDTGTFLGVGLKENVIFLTSTKTQEAEEQKVYTIEIQGSEKISWGDWDFYKVIFKNNGVEYTPNTITFTVTDELGNETDLAYVDDIQGNECTVYANEYYKSGYVLLNVEDDLGNKASKKIRIKSMYV